MHISKTKKITKRWYYFLLGMIVLFAFVSRVYRLSVPKEYIFDEVYHAVTAKLIRRNDPRAFEWWNKPVEPNTAVDWLHPPLAKYTQALGMEIFGENSFGWRISSAIFGTLVVLATAKLAQVLFEDDYLALLAAFFAASDGLLLTQSRIAMNDIHVTFFIVLTAIFYVQYRKLKNTVNQKRPNSHCLFFLFLTGLAAGLATGSKWSGVFILGVVGVFEAWDSLQTIIQITQQGYQKSLNSIRQFTRDTMIKVIFLILLPAAIYILSYSDMFLQGKTLICEGNQVAQGQCYCDQDSSWWVSGLIAVTPKNYTSYWESLEARGGCKQLISHFSELHHQIWWYQTNLKATHPYQSRPLQWFFDLRPVWFYVKYGENTVANIYAFGNPALFWMGDVAVILTVSLFAVLAIEKITGTKLLPQFVENIDTSKNVWTPLSSLFFLTVSYFSVWILWQFSPRIMFFYHYTPAVPFLCILLAYWLIQLSGLKISTEEYDIQVGRILVAAAVFVIFACFVIWYPNWTAMPVPKWWADNIYFSLPSWR